MIVSFRHKGLKLLYEKGDRRRVSSEYADKVERILARLDEATEPGNMDHSWGPAAVVEGQTCWLLVGQRLGQLAHHISVRRC